MRLLIDMNMSPRWADMLADAGFEAVHWSTVGDHAASDRQIVETARSGGYTVLTHDLDFGALLAISNASKPSVVQLRDQDLFPDESGAIVVQAIRVCETELEAGALLTIDASRHRVPILPLRS